MRIDKMLEDSEFWLIWSICVSIGFIMVLII